MAYERRDFSGSAVETTLTAGINAAATSFTIASATGWPDGADGNFYARIDSETILCGSRSGTTVNVATSGRGVDGTTAAAHSSGAAAKHVLSSVDVDEANQVVYEMLGAGNEWETWTPTWTNLTAGNGTGVYRYKQIGKVVVAYMSFTLGSTSAVGSAPSLTLPVSARASSQVFHAYYWDNSATQYFVGLGFTATASAQFFHVASGAASGALTATAPFTWATNDYLVASMTYEAAA